MALSNDFTSDLLDAVKGKWSKRERERESNEKAAAIEA